MQIQHLACGKPVHTPTAAKQPGRFNGSHPNANALQPHCTILVFSSLLFVSVSVSDTAAQQSRFKVLHQFNPSLRMSGIDSSVNYIALHQSMPGLDSIRDSLYVSGRRRMCSSWVFFWYLCSTVWPPALLPPPPLREDPRGVFFPPLLFPP